MRHSHKRGKSRYPGSVPRRADIAQDDPNGYFNSDAPRRETHPGQITKRRLKSRVIRPAIPTGLISGARLFVTRTWDHDTSAHADTRVRSLSIAPVNLKVGLLNQVDLQLILETWNRIETEDHASRTFTRQSGFGVAIPRLKFNFWGNDGGPRPWDYRHS